MYYILLCTKNDYAGIEKKLTKTGLEMNSYFLVSECNVYSESTFFFIADKKTTRFRLICASWM